MALTRDNPLLSSVAERLRGNGASIDCQRCERVRATQTGYRENPYNEVTRSHGVCTPARGCLVRGPRVRASTFCGILV